MFGLAVFDDVYNVWDVETDGVCGLISLKGDPFVLPVLDLFIWLILGDYQSAYIGHSTVDEVTYDFFFGPPIRIRFGIPFHFWDLVSRW